MISYLSGKIILKREKYVVVLSGEIGYKVFLSHKNIERAKEGEKASFFCFLEVKENSLSLFGFFSPEELELFETAEKIRGVGPKAALEISSIGSLGALRERIKDPEFKIPGIGKKKAMAVLFELEEKISPKKNEDPLIESLASLGFPKQKTKKIILETNFKGKTFEEKIKEALKILSEKGI